MGIFLENNVFLTVLLFTLPLVLLFTTVKTLIRVGNIDSEVTKTVSSSATGGIRESLVYALRGWLNARYDVTLTNDHVVSLLTNDRTPYAGEKYKLVYGDNRYQIVDFVVDNSCPSGCCDKDDVSKFVLSADTKVFKK